MRLLLCFLPTFFLMLTGHLVFSQSSGIHGTVTDETGTPMPAVNILIEGTSKGTTTDKIGGFNLGLEPNTPVNVVFKFIGYQDKTLKLMLAEGELRLVDVSLAIEAKVLKGVNVTGEDNEIREQVSVFTIKPKSAKNLPTPFGEFNKVLSTLPGVVSNNELSSTYSVRGGNFDENLVYVNDMLIYRPFLGSAGQQEGLSFVNTDLVEGVKFSAGGWQPKYGDKLSSTLNVTYKEPKEFAGSATLGLLGAAGHLEGASKNKRVSYLVGARYKSARYLLNTLDTQGEYIPKFTDVQSYIKIGLDKSNIENPSSSLGILTSYARNRYLVTPENRETEFGTFNIALRLFVAFDGRELLNYDTYQGGLNFEHKFSERLKTNVITSGIFTKEQEIRDIEGGYRLCDLDKDPNSSNFNNCSVLRGVGSNYNYSRNNLEATIINLENRWEYDISSSSEVEFGLGYSNQSIDDQLNEYSFTDSADFVIELQNLRADNKIQSNQFTGYLQHTARFGAGVLAFTYGARFNYWDLNQQFLWSPRAQLSITPDWKKDITFKGAVGLYQQPPFYRELRDFEGNINTDLKAQSALHAIVGMDRNFTIWGRGFKFLAEAYYKYIWNVVAYDVDNIRIRYYANNEAKAFATGLDLRFSGEFIPGTESWFSLGILSTKEDIAEDNNGFIRRPSDQRVNVGIFFQDHIPNNPSLRVNLNLLYGSGLPFGPPGNVNNRNIYTGDAYRRVDIGFTKELEFNKGQETSNNKTLLIGVEIQNLLGAANAISYTWVRDVSNQSFAVPNTLSARFLNIKAVARF